MATTSASASSGCTSSLAAVLTIVFVILKLTHEIAWSWWWVLAPAWVAVAFALVVFMIVVGAIGTVIKRNL